MHSVLSGPQEPMRFVKPVPSPKLGDIDTAHDRDSSLYKVSGNRFGICLQYGGILKISHLLNDIFKNI